MPGPTRAEQRRQETLARRLSETGFVLPGRLITRYMRCGKVNCRCHADVPELHGPYVQWNRSVEGRTLTRLLPGEVAQRYQGWFENANRLSTTLHELEALAVSIVERDREARS